jgi:hypothetical protein
MRTHGTGADAPHGHPALVLTATEPAPPPSGTAWLAGLMLKVQPELWPTVNVRPAMVSVPLRAGPVVAATVNGTVPLPLRVPPLAIVSQGALLVAVHSHAAAAVTATAPAPPVLATDCDSGLMP